MVKIKRKVEMTHEEYAKYMIDKYGVSGFESELIDDNIIDAPKRFTLAFELNPVPKSDLLNGSFRSGKITIEVEEVVDEDTVFNYLLLTYKKDNDKIETHCYEDKCIKSVLSQSSRLMYVSEQLSITYFDDKGIPHLIWTREKGLVE